MLVSKLRKYLRIANDLVSQGRLDRADEKEVKRAEESLESLIKHEMSIRDGTTHYCPWCGTFVKRGHKCRHG
jgi:predicted RNA-binding Zn-ribbon protein involved in translation (DUF1610 family)